MSTLADAEFLARISLHDPTRFNVQHSQTSHRLVLLQHWNIPTGSKIVELGCGQGDCTTVLAHAVGDRGCVVAVDPAELDYGVSFYLSPLLPALAVRAEGCVLMLFQAPRILSVKRKRTSREVRLVDVSRGFSDPPWTIFPPYPAQLPLPRRLPA